MKNVFFKKFLKTHFNRYWLIYLFLIVNIIYLILEPQHTTKSNRILEGISLSYIAAYIFFMLLNVVSEYFVQKEAISLNSDHFNSICRGITDILSITKLFSDGNFSNISIPNETKYLKYDDAKTFFNPREELSNCFSQIINSIDCILEVPNISLPIELNTVIIRIKKNCKELIQNFKILYNCLDDGYTTKIGIKDFSEYLLDLESECKLINEYVHTTNCIKGYAFLSSSEIIDYQNYIKEFLNRFDGKKANCKGRIYLGKDRIQ